MSKKTEGKTQAPKVGLEESLKDVLNTFGFKGGVFCPPQRTPSEFEVLAKSLLNNSRDYEAVRRAKVFLNESSNNLDLIIRSVVVKSADISKVRAGYLTLAYEKIMKK